MTRLKGPVLEEFEAALGFVGCPHCGGPVNVTSVVAQRVSNAMARLLELHHESRDVNVLMEAISGIHIDASTTAWAGLKREFDLAIELKRVAKKPADGEGTGA